MIEFESETSHKMKDRIENAYKKRDRFTGVNYEDKIFMDHVNKWNFYSSKFTALLEPGIKFLYEYVDEEDNLHYPQIGMFLHSTSDHQTIDLEFVVARRSFEKKKTFKYKSNGKVLDVPYINYRSRITNLVTLSTESFLIYGAWYKLPDWKTLRNHYENTWWFHKTIVQKRNIKVNSILND